MPYYQDLEMQRWVCNVEAAAPEVHTYSLHEGVLAEAALAPCGACIAEGQHGVGQVLAAT